MAEVNEGPGEPGADWRPYVRLRPPEALTAYAQRVELTRGAVRLTMRALALGALVAGPVLLFALSRRGLGAGMTAGVMAGAGVFLLLCSQRGHLPGGVVYRSYADSKFLRDSGAGYVREPHCRIGAIELQPRLNTGRWSRLFPDDAGYVFIAGPGIGYEGDSVSFRIPWSAVAVVTAGRRRRWLLGPRETVFSVQLNQDVDGYYRLQFIDYDIAGHSGVTSSLLRIMELHAERSGEPVRFETEST